MIALFLVVLIMGTITLIHLHQNATQKTLYWNSPIILLLAINLGAFGRFLTMPDSTFRERGRKAEAIAEVARILAHNENVTRELEDIQANRWNRPSPLFNPEATIKYTHSIEPPTTPNKTEPEVYRPTRFERDEVI